MATERVSRRKYVGTIGGVVTGLAAGIALGYMIPRTPITTAGKRILLIFSYHQEYPWVVDETSGVGDALWNKGFLIENFYMDTKRKTSPEWKKKAAEDAAKASG